MKQSLTFQFITLLLTGCLSVGTSFGQNTFQMIYGNPTYYWVGESASSVIATTDGYIVAGAVGVVGSGSNAFLMKISPDGVILWQKNYGLIGPVDEFNHIVEANDGGFLAIGETNWTVDADLLLVKTDADGNVQWQKRIGIDGWQTSQLGYYILPVPGGYVLSGGYSVFTSHEDGIMLRIDNDGNIIWSQSYSCSPATTRLVAQFVRGDTLFASGYRDTLGVFAQINATNGDLMSVQAFDGPSLYSKRLDFMAPASNGDFLLAGNVYTPIGNPKMQWACRVSSTGELKWSKTYPNVGAGPIIPLSDGNFLLAPSAIQTFPASERDATLLKISSDGEVLWSYKYGKTGPNSDLFSSALEAQDGGLVVAGGIRSSFNASNALMDIMVLKTDKNGRIESCCRQPVTTMAVPYQAVTYPSTLNQAVYLDTMEVATLETALHNIVMTEYCPPAPPEQVAKEIFICPGDSVLIAGTFYTVPGTVMDTLPGSPCDTIVTYAIQYTDLSGASAVNVQCPANQVAQVAVGANSVIVNYDTPSAQSDCLCPGIELAQVQGLPSGSDFAVGVHDICFQGQDHCGNSSECCFQISVIEDQSACDVKTNGCVIFELLRITRNADWERTYHIRVTNTCAQPLAYSVFQIPDGVTADAPANNSTYTAPSGRIYAVRNPNYSPFYSVRFASQNGGIQGGASDLFKYTLPPQSAPNYIHALVKTGTQTYTEAHLNTFNCPVEFEPNSSKPSDERNSSTAVSGNYLHLFPNPSTGVLFADWKAEKGQTLHIRIFDALGNLLFEQNTETSEQMLRIDLPPSIASGLYLFEVTNASGERAVKRFVVR